jgi:hypothetical protein
MEFTADIRPGDIRPGNVTLLANPLPLQEPMVAGITGVSGHEMSKDECANSTLTGDVTITDIRCHLMTMGDLKKEAGKDHWGMTSEYLESIE